MAKKNVVIDEQEVAGSDVASEVDAVKAAAIAKRAATNAAKKEAKEKLQAYLVENPKFPLADELRRLIAVAAKATSTRGDSINDRLKKALIEAGDDGISEMDIFKQFKIGQPEMSIKTRLFVKVKEAKERVWIRFFEDQELYKVIATGAKMPVDWDGYIPADEVKL